MQREIHMWDEREGTIIIKSILHNRRVLIVLDDVDEEKHLEALAGSHDWFGPGSRILLTSRDSHLLKTHGVDGIYKVKELNNDEALQLFSLYGFKKPYPEENYVDLSKDFMNYAQGLPLALKILGSSLFGRTTNAWKSACDKLKAKPNKEIIDVLQIGFDGLEDLQKKLFLDIACFFKGEILDQILMDILESCGYYPYINIDVLMEKSLIIISSRRLRIHDLLQKMGQEIIYQESPEEPGRRSRLWHHEDIVHVLKNYTGTNAVEGILLDLPTCKDVNVKAFSMMKKLRILKIGNKDIVENFSKLHDKYLCSMLWPHDLLRSMPTNELRVMDWLGFPLKSLPTSFHSDHLVQLHLPCSQIKQLWKGRKSLGNLKRFDLNGSKSLMEIPDFTEVPNLEILDLGGCTSLSKVHTSIGVLKRLRRLNLCSCKYLKNLPDKISLESLEYLYLSGCSRLKKFPDVVGNMTSLRILFLDGIAIEQLPLSFKCLSCLTILSLRGCKKISTFPSVICSLSSLKVLDLSGCSRLDLSVEEYLEQLFVRGTVIKFSKRLAIPEYGSNICPIRGIEMINEDSIGAFYIDYSGRLYYLRNLGEESDYVLQTTESDVVSSRPSSSVMCVPWLGPEFPKCYYIRSTDSCTTLEIHPASDDNSKWYGYSHFLVYNAHEQEKSNSKSIDSTRPDYDQFVEFVYHFETDEGILKSPLVLRVPKDYSLGSIGFGVYIPANWFLERSNNLEGWSYIKASVETRSQDVKVKECAVLLHCQKFAPKLYYEGSAHYSFDVSHYLTRFYWRTVSPTVEPLRF